MRVWRNSNLFIILSFDRTATDAERVRWFNSLKEVRPRVRLERGVIKRLLSAYVSRLLNMSINAPSSLIISGFTCNGNAHGPGLLLFRNGSRRTKTVRSRITFPLERRHDHERSYEPEFIRPSLVSLQLKSRPITAMITYSYALSSSFISFSPIWQAFAGF